MHETAGGFDPDFSTRRVALRGSNNWMSSLRCNAKHTTSLHDPTNRRQTHGLWCNTVRQRRTRGPDLGSEVRRQAWPRRLSAPLDNHNPCSSVKAADVFDKRGPPQLMQQDWPEGRVCNVTVAGTGTKFKSVGHRFSSTSPALTERMSVRFASLEACSQVSPNDDNGHRRDRASAWAVKRWRQMWLRKTAPGGGGCKQGLKRPCTETLTLHNADLRQPAITDRKPRNAY